MNAFLALKLFFSVFLLKKSYMINAIILSASFSYFVEKLTSQYHSQDLTIPIFSLLAFVTLSFSFMFFDFITGILVSRTNGEKIKSKKWATTVAKLFGTILYLCMSFLILFVAPLGYLVYTLIFGPLILSILREYISIGENLEAMYGKKPYLFTVIDKVFDIFELRFFKTLKNHSLKNEKNNLESEQHFEIEPEQNEEER